jgi:excisionase family DNA binding protein
MAMTSMTSAGAKDGNQASSGGARPIPDRLLYSPRETQELLGISRATVYRLVSAGKLKKVKIGSRTGVTAASIHRLASGAAA